MTGIYKIQSKAKPERQYIGSAVTQKKGRTKEVDECLDTKETQKP